MSGTNQPKIHYRPSETAWIVDLLFELAEDRKLSLNECWDLSKDFEYWEIVEENQDQ